MFNFKGLIKSYQVNEIYKVEYTDGYHNELNEYIKGKEEFINVFGTVTNLNTDDLKLDIGGTLDFDSRKLYCYENFKKGEVIKYKDIYYTIMSKMDYSEFDKGLNIYYMRRGERSAKDN